MVVELDQALFVAYRARLLIDGVPRDERNVVGGSFRLHSGDEAQVVVEVELSWWGKVRRAAVRTPAGGVPLEPVRD
ncbi:hypothetical protein GCM10011354_05760 [Egicoccus halophilus]|uniref:Uncharacterized protein n=1 Tax=Egicoccus halophilus TaxID=1670830 RepID=A0A8J3A5Q4_9ACTN|nr:hypothetical protein GCM10011354_05760 [Egicoccus halophilus]